MKNKIYVTFLVMSLILISMIPSITSVTLDNEIIEKGLTFPDAPEKPTIDGNYTAELWDECIYEIRSIDPQEDAIRYEIVCSDCPVIYKTGYYYSGETITFTHCWDNFYQNSNPFIIRAQAIDYYGHKSEWAHFEVEVDNNINPIYVDSLIYNFVENHPFIHQLFNKIKNIEK